MREIGALLGLTIGYILKYRLDKNMSLINQNMATKETISGWGLYPKVKVNRNKPKRFLN